MHQRRRIMIRKLFLGLVVFTLTACAMSPSDSRVPPTPIPPFSPDPLTTPDPKAPQVDALGGVQRGDLFVWIYSIPNPPIRGDNTFEAFVTDANGQPITDAKISFDIDMTNMSHGKKVVEAAHMEGGIFSGEVHFLMPGPWRVIVAIERSGQT